VKRDQEPAFREVVGHSGAVEDAEVTERIRIRDRTDVDVVGLRTGVEVFTAKPAAKDDGASRNLADGEVRTGSGFSGEVVLAVSDVENASPGEKRGRETRSRARSSQSSH
jgi:hypothetical protein